MSFRSTSRWLANAALNSPSALALLLVPAGLGFLLEITHRPDSGSLNLGLIQLSYLSALLAAAWSMTQLHRNAWVYSRLPDGSRLRAEAQTIALAVGTVGTLAMLGSILLGRPSELNWITLIGAWLHLVALGLFILRIPTSPGGRVCLALALGWVLPSELADLSGLDGFRLLPSPQALHAPEAVWLQSFVPALALVLAARMIKRPRVAVS